MFKMRMFRYIEVLLQASFPYISKLPRINLGEQKLRAILSKCLTAPMMDVISCFSNANIAKNLKNTAVMTHYSINYN